MTKAKKLDGNFIRSVRTHHRNGLKLWYIAKQKGVSIEAVVAAAVDSGMVRRRDMNGRIVREKADYIRAMNNLGVHQT